MEVFYSRPEIEETRTGQERASLCENESYPFRIKFASGGNGTRHPALTRLGYFFYTIKMIYEYVRTSQRIIHTSIIASRYKD
jgi:hypothetical protein